jgi:hypothetical protein
MIEMVNPKAKISNLPKFGKLNDIYPVIDVNLEDDEIDGNKIYTHIYEQVTKKRSLQKHNGEFLGVVFKMKEEPNLVASTDSSINTPALQGANNNSITSYRVYVPEFTSRVTPDDFYECSPSIGIQHDYVPFTDSAELSVGDIVLIVYKNKIALEQPVGIKKVSSQPLNLKKIGFSKNNPDFGGPVEKRVLLMAKKPNFGRQLPLPSSTNCGFENLNYTATSKSNADVLGKEEGSNFKDCWINGQFIGQFEMGEIDGRLFPLRYINALIAMKEDCKKETGLDLKVVDGYRSNESQAAKRACFIGKKTIDDYLKNTLNPQRKLEGLDEIPLLEPAPVAPIGTSNHNSGKAVDLNMGGNYSGAWSSMTRSSGIPNNYQEAFNLVHKGNDMNNEEHAPYGKIAWWLSLYSINYGFVWTGWSFHELWHYEIAENYIPSSLINTSATLKTPEQVVREESQRLFEAKCK